MELKFLLNLLEKFAKPRKRCICLTEHSWVQFRTTLVLPGSI